MFHHLAHFDSLTIKEGQEVRRGQLIGYVGTTGASTAPHLHYEVKHTKPDSWRAYTQGMSREDVARAYADPEHYIDNKKYIPARYDRFSGYSFLDKIQGSTMIHPGIDINSGKDGWADFRQPVLAPCDGVVLKVETDGRNGGWGNHVWIEELFSRLPTKEEGAKFARRKYGFYLQVQEHGELWIVSEDGEREYVHPDNVLDWLRKNAEGISNEDLNKIPKK
jgi:murein DD-endopeptidase MepM/ murein hydrolase activator NlpD